MAGQTEAATRQSWSGVIINSGCTAEEAFDEAAKCTEKAPGAKLAFYNDTTRQVFDLDPQDKAEGRLGDSVTIHGNLEDNTIHISWVEDLLPSIGLSVGDKAPPFSLRDQFGREHAFESLKGPRGTVLVFHRSADW